MSGQELLDRLRARAAEFRRLDVRLDGAKLIDEILTDLEPVMNGADAEPLSLTAAAAESGYSAGHLGREVKAGRIPNAGRENAPRILRRDLPRKPGNLRQPVAENMLDRKRIARAVVNSNRRANDG